MKNIKNICIFKVGEDAIDERIGYEETVFIVDQWDANAFKIIWEIMQIRYSHGIREKMEVNINYLENRNELELVPEGYFDFYIKSIINPIDSLTWYDKWSKEYMETFDFHTIIDTNKIQIVECEENE